MHSFKTEAIIIKRRNFGEADRIITAVTKNYGKIKIIAKGVRKISSKRSPHIELLNLSILNIHVGRMMILTEAEAVYHHIILKKDLQKSGPAFFICELIDGLLPENQENLEVYNLIKKTLIDLENADNERLLINKFEQDILSLLGYWPKENALLKNPDEFIESIMEKKIKTKKIFNLV